MPKHKPETPSPHPAENRVSHQANTRRQPVRPPSNGHEQKPDHLNGPLGQYLESIRQYPLLTAQEEIKLAVRIEAGRTARAKLDKGNNSGAEKKQLKRVEEDSQLARKELAAANLRLVVSIAKRYVGRGVPFFDLIQEGSIGLMQAVDKFDPHKGFRFSTYATWWIRKNMQEAIAAHGLISHPSDVQSEVDTMTRVVSQLTQRDHRHPTLEETAEALNVPVRKVKKLEAIPQQPLSLEAPSFPDDDNATLASLVPDDVHQDPQSAAFHTLLKEDIEAVLRQLTSREELVLALRYGLIDGIFRTLEEIGQELGGCTRKRIRQIEAKALKKLRHPSRTRKLRDYLE